jgi:hypothetical protein
MCLVARDAYALAVIPETECAMHAWIDVAKRLLYDEAGSSRCSPGLKFNQTDRGNS